MKRVVIVGGGFAGLNAALGLGAEPGVEITLLDRRNHHLFQPLLYQVATAGLSPAEIATPIRSLLSRFPNTRVLRSEVQDVDLAGRKLTTDAGSIEYDYLLLACGSRHAYFGHEEWEPFAPGLKTIEQATEIRRRVLDAFEEAEKETDRARQRAWLSFAIVGGGPTGVELAGAIGEMSRFTLARDFRRIDPKLARILLIEATPRILPAFDPELASRAVRDLEALGVQVWTSSPVTKIDGRGLDIGAERIEAYTVLWAAGVRAEDLSRRLGVALAPGGRVPVSADLSLAGHPEVFVAGDQAQVRDAEGRDLPALAPVALQQGRFIARQIRGELRGRPRESFHYFDRGALATIGRSRAVGQIFGWRVRGQLAWLAWLFVHVYYLVGFRNRALVVLQWAWSYYRFRRGARLIVGKEWRFYGDERKRE
ncbi:MAG TPA: NAD(P)/FAD-dependent oxidoreductase [Myxococcota bacterium]|nr:NAD(P)/FAD-dependent oxidoreductase [Myxococcota bacterium]